MQEKGRYYLSYLEKDRRHDLYSYTSKYIRVSKVQHTGSVYTHPHVVNATEHLRTTQLVTVLR